MTFKDGGQAQGPLERVGDASDTGTTVTFWPDPTIFEETELRAQTLLERLREMAFLNRGLEIVFRDERPDPPLHQVFLYEGGITDFVRHLNASKEPLSEHVIAFDESTDSSEVEGDHVLGER